MLRARGTFTSSLHQHVVRHFTTTAVLRAKPVNLAGQQKSSKKNEPILPSAAPTASVPSSSASQTSSSSSSIDLSTFRPRTAKAGSTALAPPSGNAATSSTPNQASPSAASVPSSSSSSNSFQQSSPPTPSPTSSAQTSKSVNDTVKRNNSLASSAASTESFFAPPKLPIPSATPINAAPKPSAPVQKPKPVVAVAAPAAPAKTSNTVTPPPPPPSSGGANNSKSNDQSSGPKQSKPLSSRLLRIAIGLLIGTIIAEQGITYYNRSALIPDPEQSAATQPLPSPGKGSVAFGNPNASLTKRCQIFANSLIRLWRDVYCTVRVVADYEITLRLLRGVDSSSEEYKERLNGCHLRSALRLRDLMSKNGGIYIKFGQHIAQLQFLLPDEYVDTMKPMLNRAPTSSYQEVSVVFKEEFGKEISEVFSSFDEKPIASASLAQVHFATIKNPTTGEDHPVAVKVQHSSLQENCESDIATVRVIIHLIKKWDSRFDYDWLGDEMAINLPLECDFAHEAQNSERSRKNLKCDERDDVDIPKIEWKYTSKRVLTMERMSGCVITDVASLKEQGISHSAVSSLMAQVFSEMIFLHGFVHCDPHAGNMLIQRRSATDSRPRLILLDHGLYRELPEDFRIAYSHLWSSLIKGDEAGIKKYAYAMNAGDTYPLFATMLTRKKFDDITRVGVAGARGSGRGEGLVMVNNREERLRAQAWALENSVYIQKMLAKIPKPLLLLLKTNDCLRAIDTQLGTPINSFVIMSRYCTIAINQDRLRHSTSWREWARAYWETAAMEVRIFIVRLLLAYQRWRHGSSAPLLETEHAHL